MKKIVTTALFYANGDLHLGHMLEQIQADIWVRFQKMQGVDCLFLSGDDTHGTPIMLKASKAGITPLELVNFYYTRHYNDAMGFYIGFDHYYTTNSIETQETIYQVYHNLKANNMISQKIISQLYDTTTEIFLPDRYVKGTCPKCRAPDQYGDNCEVCGSTYATTELINPRSTLSNTIPELRESEHFFFRLSECGEFLSNWLNSKERLGNEARNKMQEWLNNLNDWDISRDKPYFGFEIPNHPNKYFYVWLDAPVGYLGTLKNYCASHNLDYLNEWSSSEIHHFIGKDILYFHSLFWPAVLNCAGFKTPDAIHTHGYITVNGEKMSKSRGTFITARDYLASGLNPEYLRYYFASKLTSKIEDIDLGIDDFISKINSELVGKFINIASRSSGFLTKHFANQLSQNLANFELIHKIQAEKHQIMDYYEHVEYAKALRIIMSLVDQVNQYTDLKKPWILAKTIEHHKELHEVCSVLINCFYLLSIYLKPILPKLITQVEAFLNLNPLNFKNLELILLNHKINNYEHLISRVDEVVVKQLFFA